LCQEVDFGLGQPINGLFDFHKGTHVLKSKPRGNGVQGWRGAERPRSGEDGPVKYAAHFTGERGRRGG
jgi:hypothetical protein